MGKKYLTHNRHFIDASYFLHSIENRNDFFMLEISNTGNSWVFFWGGDSLNNQITHLQSCSKISTLPHIEMQFNIYMMV